MEIIIADILVGILIADAERTVCEWGQPVQAWKDLEAIL